MAVLYKYLTNRLKAKHYPLLLVEHSKHEPEYWLVNDEAALFRAYVKIVKARVKGGRIQAPDDQPYGIDTEADTVDDAMLAKLPKKMQADINRAKTSNVQRRREHLQELDEWRLVQEALAGDGPAAMMVIDARQDHEYERVSTETMEVA